MSRIPKPGVKLFLLLGFFSLASFAARAQIVVHSVFGTVSSIDKAANTITVDTADGSEGLFKVVTKPHVSLDFDNKIRNEATPADSFSKTGAHVVVYYFGGGFGGERSAIALRDLGPGPLEQDDGTLIRFQKHQRLLSIKTNSGEKTFHVSSQTVAETDVGPVEADKYEPEKGDQLRVIAEGSDGNVTALYIRVM